MILAEENMKWLLEQLSICGVSPKEFEHRKAKLESAQKMPGSEISRFSDRYYNLVHEIKSFCFLKQFGEVAISEDCKNNPGCDCKLKDNYQIECICSSVGKNTKGIDLFGKKDKDVKFYVGNYDKSFLFIRLTNSLIKKLKFYKQRIEKGSINPNLPYLIFLGLGALSKEMFLGENGIEFTSILFGKGDQTVSVNMETGQMISNGYTHNDTLLKYNKEDIDCNVFRNEEYCCVSGIIVSAANLDEEYTNENTWLFVNPNAQIKINPNDFPNMVYWDLYSECEYGPYKDGARLV